MSDHPDGLRFEFNLPPGSYATVLMREIMKVVSEPRTHGEDEPTDGGPGAVPRTTNNTGCSDGGAGGDGDGCNGDDGGGAVGGGGSDDVVDVED